MKGIDVLTQKILNSVNLHVEGFKRKHLNMMEIYKHISIGFI